VRKILVPLDGSELSEAILPLAEALARDYDAGLLLVRALDAGKPLDEEVYSHQVAEEYLAGLAERMKTRGVRAVEWKLWYDPPTVAIADAAARSGVDLVAMSTRGRGGVSRLLFGSVAESLVRTAPVPVLLVRGELGWTPTAVGTIVVPLDGSERSERVLPVVEALAGPFDLTVHLLHVIEPLTAAAVGQASVAINKLSDIRAAEAEAHLAKVAAPLEGKGIRVTRALRHGTAVAAILRHAREAGAGLIAMSTHGRAGLGRLLLGSVAELVLRSAPVPVLLWKAPAETRAES
jgi:nucleotide-binding universal stress UspA family protein